MGNRIGNDLQQSLKNQSHEKLFLKILRLLSDSEQVTTDRLNALKKCFVMVLNNYINTGDLRQGK